MIEQAFTEGLDVGEDAILMRNLDVHGVLRLTLNTPHRRNTLSEEMLENLGTAIENASEDKAVRVIIIAANGPTFCAGHDLKDLTVARTSPDKGRAYFVKILTLCSGVMQSIVTCPKPVIAEVDGVATAAGCQLVASCDLAIASETAKFATPGVNIGTFCSTPMVALSRNLSNKHAMEMLLTGDLFSASQAVNMGLINRTCASGELRAATMDLAHKITSKSSYTNAIGKRAFYAQRDMELAEAYDYATQIMVKNMLADDSVEGVSAFLEKRNPEWRDA